MSLQSGRDLLRHLELLRKDVPTLSNFLESFKSQRRLAMLEDVAERLRQSSAGQLRDALAEFSELDGFDVYAGDGIAMDIACHDDPFNDCQLCITHLYARNLRYGWMSPLSVCRVKEKGNHHDMVVLKSLSPVTLRQGAKKGRKVLYVNYNAALDFEQWQR